MSQSNEWRVIVELDGVVQPESFITSELLLALMRVSRILYDGQVVDVSPPCADLCHRTVTYYLYRVPLRT